MEYTAQTALTDDVQPGRALSIKRYFTTPGVHPFDNVEWETRDARIGHGDRIAFEQENVEFPKSWSQNATNIVAQKYFRGQLDTPARRRAGAPRARGRSSWTGCGSAAESVVRHTLGTVDPRCG